MILEAEAVAIETKPATAADAEEAPQDGAMASICFTRFTTFVDAYTTSRVVVTCFTAGRAIFSLYHQSVRDRDVFST